MLYLLQGKMFGCLIQEQLATWILEEISLKNSLTMLMEQSTLQTSQNSRLGTIKLSSTWCSIPHGVEEKLVFGPHPPIRTLHSYIWWQGWGQKSIRSLTCHGWYRRRKTSEVARNLCSCTKLFIPFSLWWRYTSIKPFLTMTIFLTMKVLTMTTFVCWRKWCYWSMNYS